MARIDVTDLRERCRALPQKLVLELLGFKQWTELQRFADKWRLPIGGATTDLFAVFRELRLFASKYGQVLTALIEDLPTDGSEGQLGVRYLKAKIAKTEADARAAELRVVQKEGRLVDREQVHSLIEVIANRVNKMSDRAQKRWGTEGFEFFNDLANEIEEDIRALIAGDSETETTDSLDLNAEYAPLQSTCHQ